MKKLTFILALAISMMAIAGEPYCHKQLTAGSKTVYVTAKHLSDNNYRLLIEADENMNGLGGSFVFVNGNEPYQLNTTEHFVLASDKRTITCEITSNAAPTHYTPLYVLFENGGEANFGQPDADYSQTCEGGEEGQGGEGGEGGDNPGGQGGEGGEGGEGGLTPDKPEPGDTLSPYDVNFWTNIDWLGNGSGIEANTQMYKIHCADGQQVANIQVAPWDDNNVGIYTWVESAVTSVSVAAGIQGAGLLLHLSAFVNMITEVQIETDQTTYLCFVYYKNGVDNTEPSNPSDTEDAIRDASFMRQAVKFMRDGRLVIMCNGEMYDAMGVRME